MIARVLSFKKLGSIKNPIWHLGAEPEIINELPIDLKLNEPTLIPIETLDENLLIKLSSLDRISKSHVHIQCHLDQVSELEKINHLKLKTQLWIDQPIAANNIDQILQLHEMTEIVVVPVGFFDWKAEVKKLISLRLLNYRLVLIAKNSLHDPFPTPDEYYDFINEFKKTNILIPTIIIKDQFYSLPNNKQNLFLNFSSDNILDSAKNHSLGSNIILSLAQFLNVITFNYFSHAIMSIIKPKQPTIFTQIYYDGKQIYHNGRQVYLFIESVFKNNEWKFRKWVVSLFALLYYQVILKFYHFVILFLARFLHHKFIILFIWISWPFKKVYWAIDFQIKKRKTNRSKNEV